ncbi:hypothetical protein [Bailinhaonella thermotolerans]|uniref:Uncharacterized protein n=1 Tax=Bailinhaonella thermotolerans TaxID=1070861 RepID=A0A3A4ANC5_9ACTN|nr:hypothetical protein [Bailinhaonella thermotolerans]RJL27120.1 hypothetical protein D5H75_25255 [Bailinhaonella thermotolerans]
MNHLDAQSSLDDIRRLQERTREEHLRHGFRWPYLLAVPLALFLALGSTDLGRPWSTLLPGAGLALSVALATMNERRASVRRRLTTAEFLFHTGTVLAAVVLFGVLRVAAWVVFGLPDEGALSQGVVAAAGAALAYAAATPLIRRGARAIMRRQGEAA